MNRQLGRFIALWQEVLAGRDTLGGSRARQGGPPHWSQSVLTCIVIRRKITPGGLRVGGSPSPPKLRTQQNAHVLQNAAPIFQSLPRSRSLFYFRIECRASVGAWLQTLATFFPLRQGMGPRRRRPP